MAKIIEKPPIYQGNTYDRLDQLRDYLFRIAEEINDLERSIIGSGNGTGSAGSGSITIDQALNVNSANAIANAAVAKALNGKVNGSELAAVGRTGDYNDLTNKPVIPPSAGVDTAMSDTSENAVQNKVIKSYVDGHIPASKTRLSQFLDDLGSSPTHTHSQYATTQSLADKVDEPGTEGSSGQVLATDGDGGRYWKTAGSGGGVYIGTTEPTDPTKEVWINPEGDPGFVFVGDVETTGTHQPGTYDTYTLHRDNGDDLVIRVYNGANGGGSGDMVKTVYDPQNKGTDVFGYADDAVAALDGELSAVAKSGSYNDLIDKPPGGSLEVREELITGMGINPDGNTFRDVTLTYGKTPIGVVGYYTSNHSVHVYMAYVNSANKTLTIGAHNDTTVYQPSITVHAFILYQ